RPGRRGRPGWARPRVRPGPGGPLAPATAAGATRHARRFPRHRPLPDGIGGIDGNRFRVARLPRPIPPAGPAGRTIRPRRPPPTRSAEAARDVVLGLLVRGVGEDGVGVVDLDEVAGLAGAGDVEEPGAVRDAGGLLHVVGHDHDRVLLLELMDQVLDREGRDRVQRRAGLVHQHHLGLDGDRAGDAQTLLLAAGQAHAGLVEAVLDLVPEVRAPQRLLHELVPRGAGHAAAVELDAGQHVVADRHGGERVRLLEHHAHAAAHVDRVDLRVVDVLSVDLHPALRVRAGDDLVHAVQGAQE